jgi:peptide/nickel transport system permease protein
MIWAVFTVFGVMLLTFVLFRQIAGDVSAAYVNQKLGHEARRAFYEKHKLDRPTLFNVHKRFQIVDNTEGNHVFSVRDANGARLAKVLELRLAVSDHRENEAGSSLKIAGALVPRLSPATPLDKMTQGAPLVEKKTPEQQSDSAASAADSLSPAIKITASNGESFRVPIDTLTRCGSLIAAINSHPENNGAITAGMTDWSFRKLFDSQLFWHLYESISFQGLSFATDQSLIEIIGDRAKFSLAITIPAMAMGWILAMVISALVAYYRNSWIDRVGVLMAVLGMCIPYLAYMLFGQWIMFKIAPEIAIGLSHPASIYVPVFISVIAGVGISVRFYRTIILDQINQDYVRTARAKGVRLPSILFKHVLRNCMLPILTQVIASIPFLIMGSLLLERFFGIPGLGDLMLSSITSRDVPIITGLTFLTSVLYVFSLLLTDILYAVFDPRIRLA